jgi:hypothetical protein
MLTDVTSAFISSTIATATRKKDAELTARSNFV